jgi:hypothetical protein
VQLHLDGWYSPLTYLRLRILVLRKRRRLLELIGISMVDIAPHLLVTDDTGILAAWQTLETAAVLQAYVNVLLFPLYRNSCPVIHVQ